MNGRPFCLLRNPTVYSLSCIHTSLMDGISGPNSVLWLNWLKFHYLPKLLVFQSFYNIDVNLFLVTFKQISKECWFPIMGNQFSILNIDFCKEQKDKLLLFVTVDNVYAD